MKIITFGINHKTAPIDIREKFYLTPTEQDLLLMELKTHPSIAEALILSTCNRTEIYAHVLNDHAHCEELLQKFAQIKKITQVESYQSYFYLHSQEQAIRHFFEVASGLDSIVIGEKQILGQVKTAIERSREKGMLNKTFNILSNLVVKTGKKVRHETSICEGGSSLSWAAIKWAENLLGTLKDKTLLIIGAGKMSELAIQRIPRKGLKKIYVMNRTEAHSQKLAATCLGEVVSFWDFKDILKDIDLCLCSVGAPHYIIEKSMIEKIMPLRDHRRLILIDISMPRNIDPQVAGIEQVNLAYIDHLQGVVEENMSKRQAAIAQVEMMIDQRIQEYHSKIKKLSGFSFIPASSSTNF